MTVWMDEEGPAAAIRFPAHARPTLIMTGAMHVGFKGRVAKCATNVAGARRNASRPHPVHVPRSRERRGAMAPVLWRSGEPAVRYGRTRRPDCLLGAALFTEDGFRWTSAAGFQHGTYIPGELYRFTGRGTF